MTFIKSEDFIGNYYRVEIKSGFGLEICGTSAGIINEKTEESIIGNIDSMVVVDDTVYGISNNSYFLLTLSDKKVLYSSIPIQRFSSYNLLRPIEYYKRNTLHIDIIGLIVLLCGIISIIKFVI